MNVSLTPELEELVHEKVKTGMYQTASEVVREALRLLKERDDELEALRRDIKEGLDSYERGEYEEYDEHTTKDLAEDIKARGLQALARLNKKTGTR